MGLIQLPKRFHPDFSRTGIKPIGPVEIDITGIGKHLIFSTLLYPGAVDLATGRLPTSITGYAQDVVGGNKGLLANGANTRIIYDTGDLLDPNKQYTILFRTNVNAGTPSNDFIATIKTSGTEALSLMFHNSSPYNDFTWGISEGAGDNNQRVDFSESVNDLHTYMITFDGGGNFDTNSSYKFFLNGLEKTVIEGGDLVLSTNTTVIGGEDTIFPYDGFVEYFHVFNTDLSSVAGSLSNDPYQLLKPAIPPVYFTAAAAPVGGDLLLTNRSIANFGGMRQ